jgi:hypothetical protein
MADRIAARSLLSSFRLRTCALERVATVGLELFQGGGFVLSSMIQGAADRGEYR